MKFVCIIEDSICNIVKNIVQFGKFGRQVKRN